MPGREIKAIKSLLLVWKKKLKEAEKMVLDLEAVLVILEVNSKEETKNPLFKAKYEKGLSDYLLEALSNEPKTIKELQNWLIHKDKIYSDQAIAQSLKKLEKYRRVKKIQEPVGSTARFKFIKLEDPIF